jgi:sugar transferase (PEP-CTERM/EpsH1 system associated)
MRLLYFAAHQIWPLTSGNRLRDYHLSRQLVKRASVTFVETCHRGEQPTIRSGDCDYDRIISLRKGPGYKLQNILRGMVGPTPVTVLNYFEPQSESRLAGVLAGNRFDTLQMEGIHLSRYLAVIKAAPTSPAVVIDWHNIESELMWRYSENAPSWPKRLVAKRTARLLERAELQLLERCDVHTVASEREKEKLLALCPFANVHVIPNGVDTKYFAPSELAAAHPSAEAATSNQDLLFVGSMDYHANIDAVTSFAHRVWPEIAKRHPKLKFVIVGRNPTPEVRRLESERIRVTGTVEDVRPFYASALAVVVPLRIGSGTRLKILEAMAAGVPVVATRLGAEGIAAKHGVHVLLADTDTEICSALDQVAISPQTRNRLALAARQLVATRYDWSVLGESLYQVHSELVLTSKREACRFRDQLH